MPAAPLRIPYMTTSPCFFTVMSAAANVAVHPSSHSFPTEISVPYWMLGEICAVLDLVDNKGLRLSLALWIACMRIPSGRITRGPCVVFTLLLQGVSTLI